MDASWLARNGLVSRPLHSARVRQPSRRLARGPPFSLVRLPVRPDLSAPQLARLGYMYAMGFAARCKYYFVWKWAEGSLDAGLLGFSGFSADGTASWERGKNVRPPPD